MKQVTIVTTLVVMDGATEEDIMLEVTTLLSNGGADSKIGTAEVTSVFEGTPQENLVTSTEYYASINREKEDAYKDGRMSAINQIAGFMYNKGNEIQKYFGDLS